MEFKLEDYEIFISKLDELHVEIEILRNNEYIMGSTSINFLDISNFIRKKITQNEIKEFGYCRFSIIKIESS